MQLNQLIHSALFLDINLFLPGIQIPIAIKAIANTDLGAIDLAVGWIFADGDGHCVNFICIQKVQSPPGTHSMHCCATGSKVPVVVRVSIYGFVWTGI